MCARSLSHVHTPFSRCCYLRRSRFSFRPWLSIRCICIYMFYSEPLCILLFIRVPWLCCFAFIHVPKCAQFSSVRFVRSLALTHSFSADSVVLSTSTIFHWCMWLNFFPLISRMLFTLARPGFSLAVVCDVFEQQTEAAYVTKGTFVKCLWVGSPRTQTQRLEWTRRDWALEHDILFIQFSNWGERIHLMGKQSKRLIHLRAFYWQKNAWKWLVKELDGVPMYVLMLSWAKGASTSSSTGLMSRELRGCHSQEH